MRWYSVYAEVECEELTDGRFERVADAGNAAVGLTGPAFSTGHGAVGVRASTRAAEPLAAAGRILEGFRAVLKRCGIRAGEVLAVEVQTEERLEAELAKPNEQLAGVAEVADLLGVSKQRVSELRGRPGFPAPVADLAAGPVWRVSMLQRFVEEWPRKPGRPRKAREPAGMEATA